MGETTADVAIVGAGIAGSALAATTAADQMSATGATSGKRVRM
jgi:flavin-dependent dehydrogenase